MTSLVFPDVNVWLALSSRDHQHFSIAWNWYTTLPTFAVPVFCRITQLAYLRLLTTQSVMGQGTLSQADAWQAYDRWCRDASAELVEEPFAFEAAFRVRTESPLASPKDWADAYLAAFAETAGLTLVTFDKALAGKAKGAVLLA